MTQELAAHYDVIVMGGGPAGSTLAAQLMRTSDLTVAVFDKAVFPRDHIGESMAHPVTPALEEIGALAKVLDSEVWVKKFGGIFKWDSKDPSVGFFDHAAFLEDGVNRWTAHVNRAEFDHLLLDHAADCGAAVFQGVSVSAFDKLEDGCRVTLKDRREVHATYFVDASGRRNSIASKTKRDWLSTYKNIAIWQHYEGCRSGYELAGDWNIFAEKQQSPITCAAFQDGWCWFIPVKKVIDGKRVLTHSVGIVTSPAVLQEAGKDFTDPAVFLETVKTIPLISELVQQARPVAETMLTATNYSMINDSFVSYDEGWLLAGDAAYFVDPLFSSGVAFAMGHGLSAALLLKTSADPSVPEEHKRDLWRDYDREWHGIAQAFSLAIDQWYFAIGKDHPDSIYWKSRGENIDLEIREQTFQLLLNTSLDPDLLRVLTDENGTQEDLQQDGPYMRAYAQAALGGPDPTDVLTVAPGVELRESLALDIPGFKGFAPPPEYPIPAEERTAIAQYWADPVANGSGVVSPLAAALPCSRFGFAGTDGVEVRSIEERDGGTSLWKLLEQGPVTYAELCRELVDPQVALLALLVRAGMVTATPATVQAPVELTSDLTAPLPARV